MHIASDRCDLHSYGDANHAHQAMIWLFCARCVGFFLLFMKTKHFDRGVIRRSLLSPRLRYVVSASVVVLLALGLVASDRCDLHSDWSRCKSCHMLLKKLRYLRVSGGLVFILFLFPSNDLL